MYHELKIEHPFYGFLEDCDKHVIILKAMTRIEKYKNRGITVEDRELYTMANMALILGL